MSVPAATKGNDSPRLRDDAIRFLCVAVHRDEQFARRKVRDSVLPVPLFAGFGSPPSSRGPLVRCRPTGELSESSSCRAHYEEHEPLSSAGFAIALHPADDDSAQVTGTTRVGAGEENS